MSFDANNRLRSREYHFRRALVAREAGERDRRSERERVPGPSPMADLQSRQQEAAERWKARHQQGPQVGQGSNTAPARKHEQKPELRRGGPEDDLEL
jgi:hypothetical protein